MKTQLAYWVAQFTGWTAYCALIVMAVYADNPSDININLLISVTGIILFGVFVTHLQRFTIVRLGWLNMRLTPLIPRVFVASFLSALLMTGLITGFYILLEQNEISHKVIKFSDLVLDLFSLLILVLFWNTIYFTYHFFQKSRKQEVSNLALEASNKESELKNLRSQLNPHFLFNSLNSIRALVDIEPARAKTSITTLSHLLRQSLILGKETKIPLSSEVDIAKSYLDLEKVRFEERLKVQWELDPELTDFEIPPFILQMMVENAIKHGISKLKEGGIVKVSVHSKDRQLILQVENSGELGNDVDLGVGINNTKKRLKLQYDNAAQFSLSSTDGWVTARITFDL